MSGSAKYESGIRVSFHEITNCCNKPPVKWFSDPRATCLADDDCLLIKCAVCDRVVYGDPDDIDTVNDWNNGNNDDN